MNQVKYNNKFGSLILTPVSQLLSVNKVNSKLDIVQNNLYDINFLEKVALITFNDKIQISFQPDFKKGYIMLHKLSYAVYICSCEITEFTLNNKMTPAETIKSLNRCVINLDTSLYHH